MNAHRIVVKTESVGTFTWQLSGEAAEHFTKTFFGDAEIGLLPNEEMQKTVRYGQEQLRKNLELCIEVYLMMLVNSVALHRRFLGPKKLVRHLAKILQFSVQEMDRTNQEVRQNLK